MAKITLIAGGHIKDTPEALLFNEYKKRLLWPLFVFEVKSQKELTETFLKHKNHTNIWIAMDEKGDNLTSVQFSTFLQKKIDTYQSVGFIIGIDVGIDETIKNVCHHKIAFGIQTWPHLLVRVMFVEQLYRAQQIVKKHPYHKD